jgi:hypothetical protein
MEAEREAFIRDALAGKYRGIPSILPLLRRHNIIQQEDEWMFDWPEHMSLGRSGTWPEDVDIYHKSLGAFTDPTGKTASHCWVRSSGSVGAINKSRDYDDTHWIDALELLKELR